MEHKGDEHKFEQFDVPLELQELFEKAKEGDGFSQYQLGSHYERGEFIGKDNAAAFYWYRKAANSGSSLAMYFLGKCYGEGKGVDQDEIEAAKCYQKAAEGGLSLAQLSLGDCYTKGTGVSKDDAKAVKWYRKSAEKGLDIAQVRLGDCYRDGKGVPQDLSEAVDWYTQAAENGFSVAQVILGDCYFMGRGISQDYALAVVWYQKAAENGYSVAQVSLGDCYAKGHGVSQDLSEAKKWYEKAAMSGYSVAEDRLDQESLLDESPPEITSQEVLPVVTSEPGSEVTSTGVVRWEKVHVFISSTFNDMHAERDYLVKSVFPELREWCERRKLRLMDIDLRWGVTEQDATQNKNVVKVCLDRIDDCRPFFLCFLGQRRGWVPKVSDISGKTFQEFPSLKVHAGQDSVTEMEIRHALFEPLHNGVRTDKKTEDRFYQTADHAFFYLRDESCS